MLNENLDWKAIQAAFDDRGWAVVDGFLASGVAEDIHRSLVSEVPWGIPYTGAAPEPVILTSEELAGLSMEQKASIAGEFHARARDQYAFFYYSYDLLQAWQPVLQEFSKELADGKFPGLVRYVTNYLGGTRGPVVAACFQPSCFIKQQPGLVSGGNRINFMIGFTRAWQAHMGGLLHMVGANGSIDRVAPPDFNKLVLFREATPHFVSQVATYAPEHCYWIKGSFV
jgi:hypothetical protein